MWQVERLTIRHITDSNSWPLDLSSHPELAREGAYGPDQKYTDADIKHIIRYAGEVSLESSYLLPCTPHSLRQVIRTGMLIC
jgi:hypothetical protein